VAGLDANGFVKKTLVEIKTEIEEDLKTAFGPGINLQPGSVFATMIGIFSDRVSEVWNVAEEVYNSFSPTNAVGVSLDNVVAINGIVRLPAAKSVVPDVFFFGTPGTVVPVGTQVHIAGNTAAVFETDTQITLVAGVNCEQLIEFSAVPDAGTFTITYRGQTTSAIAYNANAAAVQSALNALSNLSGVVVTGNFTSGFTVEFDGDDGLQPQTLLSATSSLTLAMVAVDIDVTETVVGEPQGMVDCQAMETGPVDAPLYTLTEIDTPVSGLDRVWNVYEFSIGRNEETDSELRLRRVNTLQVAGNATVEAIRSKLLNIPGVSAAFVFENDTLVVDMDGRPAKSFEAVVQGGDSQEIADTIWEAKPAGIQTYGSSSESVVDSQAIAHTVYFSRPTEVPIYVSIDLTVDTEFPVDGAGLAQQAILDYGASLNIGDDVIIYPRLVAALNSIPGILDMIIRIDDSAVSTTPEDPPVDDNVVIAAFARAVFSAPNTDINIL
jgi:uncharacterized phage protein gp47/JayE